MYLSKLRFPNETVFSYSCQIAGYKLLNSAQVSCGTIVAMHDENTDLNALQ